MSLSLNPRVFVKGLPGDLIKSARNLAYRPDAYFLIEQSNMVIGLDRLKLTRARPDGIASALVRMREAAIGERARRPAISVRLRRDGCFDVLDGNSTVVIATAANWKDVPCSLAPSGESL